MTDPRTTEQTVLESPVQAIEGQTVEAQVLVEDVSIDGMCGVY